MNCENENNIRKKYEELLVAKKEIQKKVERKKELEEDPFIQEYLNLVEELEESDVCSTHHLLDRQLLDEAIQAEKITESNGIFVCMGTYRYSYEIDIIHGSNDCPVAKNDPSADYRIYADIEKRPLEASFELPIKQCEEFERENTVLYPRQTTAGDYYYTVRNFFFKTAIESNQTMAVQGVLQKYKKSK